MTNANVDREVSHRLSLWMESADELARIKGLERIRKRQFVEVARDHGWSWSRIGMRLGQTSTAARRWYERNRA